MSRDRLIRRALWATVALNTLGVIVFAPPALGYHSPLLPVEVPRYFAAQVGFTIALFGGVYAWLALQPRINRALIVVGGVGKLGFFAITLIYAIAGDVPAGMALSATPDLVLAAIFLWWARLSPPSRARPTVEVECNVMRTPTVFVAALTWAVLVVAGVHFLDFPGSVPNFQQVSSGGTLLDAVPAFTADSIYQRLDAYGHEGRKNYFFRNVTVDILLPLSALPFLFLLMLRAVTAVPVGRWWRATLLSVPLVYVIFDLIENSIVLVLLSSYPERLNPLAMTLPPVTVIKRIASLLALGVPLMMLGFGSFRRFQKPKLDV